MIIRSPRPTTSYTVVGNDVVRNHRLTWRARGILVYLLSMPDHWRTSSVHLSNVGVEGRDAVRAALRELEAAGYLHRVRCQDDRGRWTTATYVYDRPVDKTVGNPVDGHVDIIQTGA